MNPQLELSTDPFSHAKKGLTYEAMSRFGFLNLHHKATLNRVLKLLTIIDLKGKETWLRIELDDACGLPNKPLAINLRKTCFVQVCFYSPRSNVWNEYKPNPEAVAELRQLVKDHLKAEELQKGTNISPTIKKKPRPAREIPDLGLKRPLMATRLSSGSKTLDDDPSAHTKHIALGAE